MGNLESILATLTAVVMWHHLGYLPRTGIACFVLGTNGGAIYTGKSFRRPFIVVTTLNTREKSCTSRKWWAWIANMNLSPYLNLLHSCTSCSRTWCWIKASLGILLPLLLQWLSFSVVFVCIYVLGSSFELFACCICKWLDCCHVACFSNLLKLNLFCHLCFLSLARTYKRRHSRVNASFVFLYFAICYSTA